MLIGYARVSTQDQNLDLQTAALNSAGCDRIFDDMLSGTRRDRPGLERALDVLWSKGYEATSLDDLCEATDLSR